MSPISSSPAVLQTLTLDTLSCRLTTAGQKINKLLGLEWQLRSIDLDKGFPPNNKGARLESVSQTPATVFYWRGCRIRDLVIL